MPPCLIVSGPEAGQAAGQLFPEMRATWPEGPADLVDFGGLRGNPSVTGWLLDRNQAGIIHTKLKALGVTLKVVDTTQDLPALVASGVDIAALRHLVDQAQPWAGGEAEPIRRLDVRTWAEIRHKVVPPPAWLCEPLFPKVAFGIVASQPGHGKSFTTLQLAIALATGLHFMGHPVNGPCGVGILSLEDDDTTTDDRMQKIVAAYGSEFTEEHHRLLAANFRILERKRLELAALTPEALDMALAGLAQELGETMKTTEAEPGLLVIDTLNSVHEGEESSATETRPLVATIFALHMALGCSVWVLHHYRKAGLGKSSPGLPDRMDPEIIRGSTAIIGGIRGAVQMGWVTKAEAEKAGLLDWTDPHHYVVIGLTKHNAGPKSKWELWKHSDGGVLVPVRDGELAIARIRGGDAVMKLAAQDQVLVAIHRAALGHTPFDRKSAAAAICGTAGDPAGTLRAVLSNLRRDKLITKGDTLTLPGFTKAQRLAQGTASDDETEDGETL